MDTSLGCWWCYYISKWPEGHNVWYFSVEKALKLILGLFYWSYLYKTGNVLNIFTWVIFKWLDETKRIWIGLLPDIRKQWGLLETRQKKFNANKMTRKKVMAFLKNCTCTYFKVRRGTNACVSIIFYYDIIQYLTVNIAFAWQFFFF